MRSLSKITLLKKIVLPKSITILGREIPIEYCTGEQMEALKSGAGGLYDTWARKIYICNEAPIDVQLYWIFHEVTHSSHHTTGIDQQVHSEFEEVLCQTTASLIEDVLNSPLTLIWLSLKKLLGKK